MAALTPDKKLDRFYPKQKNTLQQNNLTYQLGPVSPPSGDSSPLGNRAEPGKIITQEFL